MRSLLLLALVCPMLVAQDAHEIVRRAVELDKGNDENWRNYTYQERQLQKEFDGDGKVKKNSLRTYQVTFLDGSPYRRLIARNDQPLPPAEMQTEEEKQRQAAAARRAEPKEQRERRIAEWRKRQERQREPLNEIPDAFTFQIVGSENVKGIDTYVIDATPRPGYKPKSAWTGFLPKMKTRIWIAKRDYRWVKLDAETIDSFAYMGLVVRVGKGAHITMEQAPVGDGVWLPTRIALAGSARILLVKSIRAQLEMQYSNYRKS